MHHKVHVSLDVIFCRIVRSSKKSLGCRRNKNDAEPTSGVKGGTVLIGIPLQHLPFYELAAHPIGSYPSIISDSSGLTPLRALDCF